MNSEARLLYTLWDTISHSFSASNKHGMATSIIRILVEYGECDIELLQDAEGECEYLDRALEEVKDELADPDFDGFEEFEER